MYDTFSYQSQSERNKKGTDTYFSSDSLVGVWLAFFPAQN